MSLPSVSGFVVNRGAATQYDELVSATTPLPVQLTTPATNTAARICAFVRGHKAPADVDVPEALAADNTFVSTVTIFAQRASRVANSSNVYVDATATNNLQAMEIAPGGAVTMTAPPGKVIDLNDLYVDSVTVTDGVFYIGML